jgi:cell wall-associated NlpC family hydrolase
MSKVFSIALLLAILLLLGCTTAQAQPTSTQVAPLTPIPGITLLPSALDVSQSFQYPFQCNEKSLTADFAERDKLPQTSIPEADWYKLDDNGEYIAGGWGPRALTYPKVQIPSNTGCDAVTWQRERTLKVALRYLNLSNNPLALDYRHHHIPAWNPPANTHVSGDNDDPETNDLGAWNAGPGLDCSNFASWVYNYGLGIKFTSAVRELNKPSLGVPAKALPKEGPFQPGDLIYLHPTGNTNVVSHVVIYINDHYVIDDRYDYRAPNGHFQRGVLVRPRVGWYRSAALGGWRLIGE